MTQPRIAAIAALILCLALSSVTAPAVLAADEEPLVGKQINWHEYITSAMLVGSIAAAMSRVEHCSKKPLLIEEWRRNDTKRDLVFTCDGNEDEQGSAILTIEKIGGPNWEPTEFRFAG